MAQKPSDKLDKTKNLKLKSDDLKRKENIRTIGGVYSVWNEKDAPLLA